MFVDGDWLNTNSNEFENDFCSFWQLLSFSPASQETYTHYLICAM